MWIVGKASKEEVERIEESGFEIDRIVTNEELDKFVNPSFTGKSDGPEEGYTDLLPLVWLDYDIMQEIQDIIDQEKHPKQPCVVVCGNLADGIIHYGPFNHPAEANEWADHELRNASDSWYVLSLTAPEGM